MGGPQGDDEPHPEVWPYEGPTVDGSPRFKVGDRVDVSGIGGPCVVAEVRWDGDWVYELPGLVGSLSGPHHWLREQRADGKWQDRPFYPQTHMRFSRRAS